MDWDSWFVSPFKLFIDCASNLIEGLRDSIEVVAAESMTEEPVSGML